MSFSGHAYKLLKDLQNDAKKQDWKKAKLITETKGSLDYHTYKVHVVPEGKKTGIQEDLWKSCRS